MKPKWVWPPEETQSDEKWHFDTARIQVLSPYADLDILTKCFVGRNWLSPLKIHPLLTVRFFTCFLSSSHSLCVPSSICYSESLLICWRGHIDVTVHTNVVMHYTGHYIYQIRRGGTQEAHVSKQCEVAFGSLAFHIQETMIKRESNN